MHHWACFTPRLAREERGEARERDSKRETEKKTARQWKREKEEEERDVLSDKGKSDFI